MSAEFYTIASVFIISLISLAGVFTVFFTSNIYKRINFLLISLAAGTLIGDVFFHIIPEVYSEGGFENKYTFALLGGILGFFVLEKILHWRHCHLQHDDHHTHPVAVNNLVADGIHNFIDGLVIAAGFSASIEIGIATTIAVILHEIPQEIGDFGILIHAGLNRAKALMFNFASALLAVIGAVFGLIAGNESEELVLILLSIAAGGFIYISIADLIPEINKESSVKKGLLQLLIVFLGIVFMFGVTYLESDEVHGHGEDEINEMHEEDDHDEE